MPRPSMGTGFVDETKGDKSEPLEEPREETVCQQQSALCELPAPIVLAQKAVLAEVAHVRKHGGKIRAETGPKRRACKTFIAAQPKEHKLATRLPLVECFTKDPCVAALVHGGHVAAGILFITPALAAIRKCR